MAFVLMALLMADCGLPGGEPPRIILESPDPPGGGIKNRKERNLAGELGAYGYNRLYLLSRRETN